MAKINIYFVFEKIQIDQNLVESELKNLIKKQQILKNLNYRKLKLYLMKMFMKTLEEINNQINEFGFEPIKKV